MADFYFSQKNFGLKFSQNGMKILAPSKIWLLLFQRSLMLSEILFEQYKILF